MKIIVCFANVFAFNEIVVNIIFMNSRFYIIDVQIKSFDKDHMLILKIECINCDIIQ